MGCDAFPNGFFVHAYPGGCCAPHMWAALPPAFLANTPRTQQPHARCAYTGLLYCPRCHTGQTAVLPATVLHAWDFAKQPVCTLAAEYLASIQDKPLLCVGAVNPGLHARVPTLARAHDLRVRAYKALAAAQDKVRVCVVMVADGLQCVLSRTLCGYMLAAQHHATTVWL